MTLAQEKGFKTGLEARRSDLIKEISARREGLSIERASEAMDQVRCIENGDLAARIVERLCVELRLIESALQEIREGTFGVCAGCGRRIPMRRLEAVPWSPYCVGCQERVEVETTYELAS